MTTNKTKIVLVVFAAIAIITISAIANMQTYENQALAQQVIAPTGQKKSSRT